MNYTNFFDFGVNVGDAQLGRYLDGSGSGDAHFIDGNGSGDAHFIDGSGSGDAHFIDGSSSGDAHSGRYLDGSSSGDAHLERYLDGSSLPKLSTPIQFFGTTQDTLFVSQLGLYFHFHTGTIDDGCLIYSLVVTNNNAVTDFCTS